MPKDPATARGGYVMNTNKNHTVKPINLSDELELALEVIADLDVDHTTAQAVRGQGRRLTI
jgi:hypothetical protein